MANTYPILTSNALSALLNAIKQDGTNISPLDSEAANVLGAVDRQTRWFMYSFLNSVFDDNGLLKPGTVNGQGPTFNQQISGSVSNSPSAQAVSIIQGTISTPDLRPSCITAAQLAAGSVGPAALQAGLLSQFVTLSLTNWITATMLTNQSVGTAAIVDAAVTAQKIALQAVSAAQIAVGGITYDRLANALGSGYMLVSGLTPFTFAAVPMTGDGTLDSTGKFTLTKPSVAPFVVLAEQAAQGTHAGDTTTGFFLRGSVGVTPAVWTVISDASSLMTALPINDGKIKIAAGTYLVEGQTPGYQCGAHKSLPQFINSVGVVQSTIEGASAVSATSSGVQTISTFSGVGIVPAGGALIVYQSFASSATHGMGFAANSGGHLEVYSTIKLTKIA